MPRKSATSRLVLPLATQDSTSVSRGVSAAVSRRDGAVRSAVPGLSSHIVSPSPITPTYNDYLIFEGISVDESGKQYYLDVNVAYRQACLNAIEYLK